MSDNTLAGQAGTEAPADPPASSASDIEAVKAQLAAYEDRFKGLQRVIAEKDVELKTMRTAGLSEDERLQLERDEVRAELAKEREARQLLELRQEFPDEVDVYQRLRGATDARETMKVIRDLRQPKTAAGEEPASDLVPPPTDSANPPRNPQNAKGTPRSDGTVMTLERAEAMLAGGW